MRYIWLSWALTCSTLSAPSLCYNVQVMERNVCMPWPLSWLRHKYVVVDGVVYTSGPSRSGWDILSSWNQAWESEEPERGIQVESFQAAVTREEMRGLVREWNQSQRPYGVRSHCYHFADWLVQILKSPHRIKSDSNR